MVSQMVLGQLGCLNLEKDFGFSEEFLEKAC